MFLNKVSHIYIFYSNEHEKLTCKINHKSVEYVKFDYSSQFLDKKFFREESLYKSILDAYNKKYASICLFYADSKILDETFNGKTDYNIFCLNPCDVKNDIVILNKLIIDYIASLNFTTFKDTFWKEHIFDKINKNFKIGFADKNIARHKIDYVLTYVNNKDKNWLTTYRNEFGNSDYSKERFNDYGTLDLLISGIRKYASFIDDIYVIVQNKSEVKINREDIKIIEHSSIIPDNLLPTFNSCTIEMFLGNIKGLSEYFIYGNDDMFFINKTNISDFFDQGKLVGNLISVPTKSKMYYDVCINSFKLIVSEFNIQYFKETNFPKQYKALQHTPHPLRKSSYLHVSTIFNDKLLESCTKLRENSNFNQYIFTYYDYLIGNFKQSKELSYKYCENIIYDINDNTKLLCLNEYNEFIYEFLESNLKNIALVKTAVCAIAKNENIYLREWVEHYKQLGFSKIFLYDNNDKDGEHFEEVINDYINSGFVEVIDVRGVWPAQIDAYESFYHSKKSLNYSWILFCDIDEFLEFQKDKYASVSDFLSDKIFNEYDVIKLCWKYYDDNDLVYVDNNNYSIKRFKNAAPNKPYTNAQTKMFLRTNKDAHIISPHGALTKNGYNEHLNVCNTRGEKRKTNDIMYSGDPSLYVHDNCWLNHYRFKTIEEYIIKTKRGWPTIYMDGGKQYMNARFFFLHNRYTREKHKLFAKLLNRDYLSITTYGSINQNKNWGDDINFSFIQELFDYKYECIHVNKNMNETNYAFIGSILEDKYLTPSTIVWGAGIPDKDQIINIKPKKILAVRGPLTRKKLLEQGIKCPAVYGDPALLIHLVYNPQIEKKYKLGIIPHFSNLSDEKLNEAKMNKNIKIINLKTYKGCWKNVIDDILSCEYIISESLHGLIIAESYKIPNLWINVSDNKSKNKGSFKYLDFYHSIGKTNIKNYVDILDFNDTKAIIELINKTWFYKFNINLNKLISKCPIKLELKQLDKNINTNNTEIKI